LLTILAFNQILVYTNILMTTLLVARGRSRTLMFLTLGMLVWNIALNFVVIPRYGALGAAWTTMATELAGTIGCLAITSTGWVFLQTIGRLAIPAAVCAALLALLAPATVELTAQALWPGAAVLLVYGVAIVVTRVFDPEERKQLKRLAWQ
jgi:O-antigen/teichoic acid export membrane protein